jgi:hypothetical protein
MVERALDKTWRESWRSLCEPIRAYVQEALEERMCAIGSTAERSKDTEADLERNGTELSAVLGQMLREFWRDILMND